MLLKVSELNDVEKKELITFTQGYLFEEVTHLVFKTAKAIALKFCD